MAGRALVLGGGGTVGIAWETGMLKGLQDAGIAVEAAELIVGTSAGSVVGAQLALGTPLADLMAFQLSPLDATNTRPIAFDPAHFAVVAQTLGRNPSAEPAAMAALGTLALAAPTDDEETYVERFAYVGDRAWPERALLVTAIDAHSGEFRTWDRSSGAPLQRAVASSCAVPAIFPPVTIGERRYIDGGMRSSTNADLAEGHDAVLIITPISAQSGGWGPSLRRGLDREVAKLREAGCRVVVIEPDAEALAVFGPNMMDVSRRAEAANAGVRQSRQFAEAVRALWA
jgi:NTE family protein